MAPFPSLSSIRRRSCHSRSVARASSRSLALAAALALAACADDVAEPYQLDHARVLAVRTTLAQLGPGQRGALEVLFTDSTAQPRLATDAEVTATLPPELDRPELAGLLARRDGQWQVQAPDAAALAAARAALAVPVGAPLQIPLDVRVASADGTLLTQKLVSLGVAVENPPPPEVRIAGAAVEGPAQVPAGAPVALAVSGVEPDAAVRWFSSVGELRRYTQVEAELEASELELADGGTLAVVVRSSTGGVAWRLVRVAPAPNVAR